MAVVAAAAVRIELSAYNIIVFIIDWLLFCSIGYGGGGDEYGGGGGGGGDYGGGGGGGGY